MNKPSFLNPTKISITELAKRYHKHPGPFAIAEKDLQQIFKGIESVEVALPQEHIKGDTDLSNYQLITRLVKYLNPKIIVEIGTFRGKTTLGLAKNSPINSLVVTIGLPIEKMNGKETNYGTDNPYFLKKAEIGSCFKDTIEEQKIKQIYADSHSNDCKVQLDALIGNFKIDFAFIDGAHDYDSVKYDFEKVILPRLSKNGVVIFDDYSNLATQPGVASYLTQKAREENFVFYWYTPFSPPNAKNSTCILYINSEESTKYNWKNS